MGRGYLDSMKSDMCVHVFDCIDLFLEEHGDEALGQDVPFPQGYVPLPKVTAVVMKLTAGN